MRASPIQPPSESNREANSSQLVFTRKRPHLDVPSDINDHNTGSNSVLARKRPNRDSVDDDDVNNCRSESITDYHSASDIVITSGANSAASHSVTETGRVQANVIVGDVVATSGGKCIDPMQVVLLEIRREVCQLTDLVRSTNQKDNEIARYRVSTNEMLLENENLMKDHRLLKDRCDEQSALIIAMQKGLEAMSKLQIQAENDLSASLVVNEQMKLEITDLKSHIQNLSVSKNFELNTLTKTNENLQHELKVFQNESTAIVTELKGCIDVLKNNVAIAEKTNSEMMDDNKKLQEKLSALNDCSAAKDIELTDLRCRLRTLSSNYKTSNIETQTVICINKDKELQFNFCSEYVKDVQVQTDTRTIEDVEIQVDLLSESREKGDMNSDTCSEEIDDDDPVVKACREILLNLEFGWMKFGTRKNSKFCPGFVYPPDADGISRAQKVEANGYPSDTKFIYFDFNKNIPDDLKKQPETSALNKMNEKFKFHLK